MPVTGAFGDMMADRMYRANLNGSNRENLFSAQGPRGLAAPDLVNGKLYWVDSTDLGVRRANLDGTMVEDLVTTGLVYPRDIVLH